MLDIVIIITVIVLQILYKEQKNYKHNNKQE